MGGQCQNTGAGRCTGSARTTVRVFGHDYSVCYPCGAEIRRKQEHLPTRREEPVWQAGRFAAAMGSQHAGQQTRRLVAARMFYRMEGWERYWSYEQRPAWLRKKYPLVGGWDEH